jgi:KDO2-lipid IV(A) lauroyltransferase
LESFAGIDHLFAAYDRGCGVVLVTAHLGGPEFAMRAASYFSLDILALTERLQPPRVNALLQRARRRHGGRFVEAGLGGTRDALEQLRAGALVALVADRDILGTGVPTTFFGATARLPPGPIELALRTGAAVVPCFVLRRNAGMRAGPRCAVRFLPPLALPRTRDRNADLHHGLEMLARVLEVGISMAPDQWFALQPVWRAPAPARRTAAP